MATQTLIEQFRQQIGNVTSTTDERQLRMKSRDFYWYSPVLTPQLQNCRADIVVQPRERTGNQDGGNGRRQAADSAYRSQAAVRGITVNRYRLKAASFLT